MPFSPVILSEVGVLRENGSLAFTGVCNHMCCKIALHLLFRGDFGSGQIPVEVDSSEFASERQVFGVWWGADPSVREPGRGGDLGCESFGLIKSSK